MDLVKLSTKGPEMLEWSRGEIRLIFNLHKIDRIYIFPPQFYLIT